MSIHFLLALPFHLVTMYREWCCNSSLVPANCGALLRPGRGFGAKGVGTQAWGAGILMLRLGLGLGSEVRWESGTLVEDAAGCLDCVGGRGGVGKEIPGLPWGRGALSHCGK